MELLNKDKQIILRVQNLKKYFPIRRGFFQKIAGWVKAVDDVSFEIEQGKTLGLVGESGCGKTTVARLILKLLEPDHGKIIFRGSDIGEFTEKDMKPIRKEIQIVFQDPFGSLNPRMTTGLSVEEGLRILGIKRGEKRKERLEKLLKMVGMSPDNVSIQAQIINLLKDLQDRLGLSYLFISHDLNVVSYLCSTISVMYKGQIMESAPAEELFENPCHPYTMSLLSAIPDPEPGIKREIEFVEPDLSDSLITSNGCNFQGRCPIEEPRCLEEKIGFEKVGEKHFVRCWKAAKK